jgi:RHS repeat-associated protein
MKRINTLLWKLWAVISLLFVLLAISAPVSAHPGGFSPICFCACEPCGSETTAIAGIYCRPADTTISISRGDLQQHTPVASLNSAFGAAMDFALTYRSYNADDSNLRVDSGLGYGWTHAYNTFLFIQRQQVFRMDGLGNILFYRRGQNGSLAVSNHNWFETLSGNPGGPYTVRQKDGTRLQFSAVADTPFMVAGPVYRLTSITDRNNNTTTLTYTSGNLTGITDTYGRSLVLAYNPQNKLIRITDPLGRKTEFHYDGTGRNLSRITDANGKSTQYHYNSLSQIIQKTDRDGRTFTFGYNAQNKPVSIKDATGATLLTLSNPTNWAIDDTALAIRMAREYVSSTTTHIDGRGNVWKYDYDKNGYVTHIVPPPVTPRDNGGETFYEYDPVTLFVSKVKDARDNTTEFRYDSMGNLMEKKDALGNVTSYTYDPVFNQRTSMTDANNRTTIYTIDPANGNVLEKTDPTQHVRAWTYDSHGNVLAMQDKRGFFTKYEYDNYGNRTKVTDPLGEITIMTYDVVGNMLSRTDANNHTTSYAYDNLDRRIRQIDPPGGGITQTFYDGEGNQIGVIDANGNPTTYLYDLRQRLTLITDALRQTTQMSYDANDNRETITDKRGQTTRFFYDERNRLSQTRDALNYVRSQTYDSVNNVVTTTNANTFTTFYEYDKLNRLIQRKDPIQKPGGGDCITVFMYDTPLPIPTAECSDCTGPTKGSDLISMQRDGNGKITYFAYDDLDRRRMVLRKQSDAAFMRDADDAATITTYDPDDNVLSETEPNGNITRYAYDPLSRRTTVLNPALEATQFTYDPVGNVKTVMAPTGNITTHSYDALNRVTAIHDNEGAVGRYTYDAVGNRLTMTDGNGNTTTSIYDPLYRVTIVTDALGASTAFGYDPVGSLLKQMDRNGNVTMHRYDALNRRSVTRDAIGARTRYEYDGEGNVTAVEDAKMQTTRYQYDGMNRRTKEIYPDPPPNTRRFEYDCVGNVVKRLDQKGQLTQYFYSDLYFLTSRIYPSSPSDRYTYDLSGRMLTATRGGWPVTFAYDGANRITQSSQNGALVRYAYDIPKRRRMVVYPGGKTIMEQMDFRTRLETIADGGALPLVRYSYDAGDRVGTRTYRNGVTASFGYDANDRVLSLEHTRGSNRIAGFGYAYDAEGNKRFEQKRHNPSQSEAYRYDNIYRLTDYRVGALANGNVPVPTTHTAYDLDLVGNWNRKIDAIRNVTESRAHNAANEITTIQVGSNPGVSIAHDDTGNLSRDERYAYAYDEENRLTQVRRLMDNRLMGQYQYDALGRRVAKLSGNGRAMTITRYFYDGARIIEERNLLGTPQATYVYGNYVDEVLTMNRGAQTFYYHQNALFSVSALTNEAGVPVEYYSYDAYGKAAVTNGAGNPILHSAVGNPFLFTGRQLDEETGLYYYRARYYDSDKGRFLQRDPLGYVDGMNLYQAYFVPNKLDPTGRDQVCCKKWDPIWKRGFASSKECILQTIKDTGLLEEMEAEVVNVGVGQLSDTIGGLGELAAREAIKGSSILAGINAVQKARAINDVADKIINACLKKYCSDLVGAITGVKKRFAFWPFRSKWCDFIKCPPGYKLEEAEFVDGIYLKK